MAFNTAIGRAEYTASAAQTDFTFAFKIYNTSDVKVYLTPSGQTADDATDILIETTDYTVTINGDNGGDVTLTSGATLNDAITLVRDLPVDRDTEYQQSGDLTAAALNEDQDYQTYLILDGSLKTNERALIVPDSAQDFDTTLPAPGADKMFIYASDGKSINLIDPSNTDFFKEAFIVNSMQALLGVDETTYGSVNVRGYSTISDGGGGLFNWDSTIDKSTANAGTIIDPDQTLANQGNGTGNGCWVRQYKGYVTSNMFGGATQAALALAINYFDEVSIDGEIEITSTLTISKRLRLIDGTIKGTSGIYSIKVTSDDVQFENIIFDGQDGATNVPGTELIRFEGTDNGAAVAPTKISNFKILNCTFKNSNEFAVKLQYVSNAIVDNCSFDNITYAGVGANSSDNVTVVNSLFCDITVGDTNTNCYGVFFSNKNLADIVRDPVSSSCSAIGNTLYNISWEALDTHGGQNIKFSDNIIDGSQRGITSIPVDDEVDVTTSAANYVVICNNVISNCSVSGISVRSDTIDSIGTVVTGNVITACGSDSETTGGIKISNSRGVVIANNTLSECFVNGIYIEANNKGFVINDNTFIDVISATRITAAIVISASAQQGVISGNSLSKSGIVSSANLNIRGISVPSSLTDISIELGNNTFDATSPNSIPVPDYPFYTPPILISGSETIAVTTAVNAVLADIPLNRIFTRVEGMLPVATLDYGADNNHIVRTRILNDTTLRLYIRTSDGANFSTDKSIIAIWQISGY